MDFDEQKRLKESLKDAVAKRKEIIAKIIPGIELVHLVDEAKRLGISV